METVSRNFIPSTEILAIPVSGLIKLFTSWSLNFGEFCDDWKLLEETPEKNGKGE
jgi:hypothetical protein